MPRLLIALAVAALLLPAGAAAQFAPLPPAPAPAPETVVVGPGQDDGGLSTLEQTLLVLIGAGLVVAIGVAISRDAKKNAPAEPRGRPEGRIAPAEREQRHRADAAAKARAKRARQARKKNRPTRK